MAFPTKKFSQLPFGSNVRFGDEVVGVRGGADLRIDFPSDGIMDGDGNYLFKYSSVGASAINYININNSSVGSPVEITSDGSDVNIGLSITTKGTGSVFIPENIENVQSIHVDNLIIDGDTISNDNSLSFIKINGNVDISPSSPFLFTINNGPNGIDEILDEDDMVSNSETALATQQSIKTYIDTTTAIPAGLQSVQVFIADGIWNRPPGVIKIIVKVIGGGGGGGGVAGSGAGRAIGGSGGGGGFCEALIDVTSLASETVTVGLGGPGGPSGDNAGQNGQSSSFGVTYIGGGGEGGNFLSSSGSNVSLPGGVGGSAVGGYLNAHGQTGGVSHSNTGTVFSGPGGCSGYTGGGGAPAQILNANGSVPGNNANSEGGGGSGAVKRGNELDVDGGNGESGIVIVYEYK